MFKKLEGDEKMKYLNEINKFYNYDKSIINTAYTDYNIYEKKYGDTIVKISDDTRNKLYQLLEYTVKFLNKKRIDYWLDGGTLLGACRDGKIIDIDDDIDLAVPHDSYIKLNEIIKTLKFDKKKYMYISKKFNIGFTLGHGQSKNKIYEDLDSLMKTHLLDNNDIFIDLFLYVKYKDRYISNFKGYKYRTNFEIEHMYPFKKIQFGEHKYNCVKEPYNFLNDAYWFWKHLNLASKSHTKEIKDKGVDDRSKVNYFLL